MPIVTEGTGDWFYGKLRLQNVVYAPSLSHNLVSGIQIMKLGYRQEIEADKLYDSNGNIVASGDYDHDTGLIKINTNYNEVNSAMTVPNWHTRFGHLNGVILSKTMRQYNIVVEKDPNDCEPCQLGKTRKQNVPKAGSTPNNYMDIIEIDCQGPFPLLAHESTNSNAKFVEAKSGWGHMASLQDLGLGFGSRV